MRFYCLYILFFCCVLTYNLTAQSNFKQKQIVVKSDTVFLDSLSLIPGSIKLKLKETELDSSDYKIYYPLKEISFKKKRTDTLMVYYKTFD